MAGTSTPAMEALTISHEAQAPVLTSAELLGLSDSDNLPSTASEFQKCQFHDKQAGRTPVYFIQYVTQRLVRFQRQLEDECPGAEQATYNIIRSINMLEQSETFSFADYKMLNIEFILKTVKGECPGAKGPYSYPQPLQSDATAVLEAAKRHIPAAQGVPPEADVAGNGPLFTVRTHKRRRTNEPQQQQQPLVVSSQDMTTTIRGLVFSDPDAGRRTWSLDKAATARNCNVVGHNGIAIGTWWPYRICALRDGAHGATMAGIAGSVSDGAYSIVVSGSYADLDRDFGDILYYSGSKAHDNTDPNNPIITTSTRALQTSKREDRSVRVLRAAGGEFPYAPSVGMRYDGLYKIVEERLPLNHKGGRYARFKLVRNASQAPIDLFRPNARERAIFEQLKQQR